MNEVFYKCQAELGTNFLFYKKSNQRLYVIFIPFGLWYEKGPDLKVFDFTNKTQAEKDEVLEKYVFPENLVAINKHQFFSIVYLSLISGAKLKSA